MDLQSFVAYVCRFVRVSLVVSGVLGGTKDLVQNFCVRSLFDSERIFNSATDRIL